MAGVAVNFTEILAPRLRLIEAAPNGRPGEGQWRILLREDDQWQPVDATVVPEGKEWRAVAYDRRHHVHYCGVGVDALDAAMGVISDHNDHVAGNRPRLATTGDSRVKEVARYETWDLKAMLAWLPTEGT